MSLVFWKYYLFGLQFGGSELHLVILSCFFWFWTEFNYIFSGFNYIWILVITFAFLNSPLIICEIVLKYKLLDYNFELSSIIKVYPHIELSSVIKLYGYVELSSNLEFYVIMTHFIIEFYVIMNSVPLLNYIIILNSIHKLWCMFIRK